MNILEILTKENIDKYLSNEPQLHTVLTLRCVKNLSQISIAEALDLNRVQVSRLEKRAILIIRKELGLLTTKRGEPCKNQSN